MVSQIISSTENAFTKGLVTEFTGLNFPENAATDTDNCEYTLVGDVLRREGINYEANNTYISQTSGGATATYKWNNAGGDGDTQVIVVQNGNSLRFTTSSSATIQHPLSTQFSGSNVGVSDFVATGSTYDSSKECQFSDGNGYLFVYHPDCDPFFCTYAQGTVTATRISIQIRDFAGVPEPSISTNTRPNTLELTHDYNLQNQGWTEGGPWAGASVTSNVIQTGTLNFTIQSGFTIPNGTAVRIAIGLILTPNGTPIYPSGEQVMIGSVTGYSGTTLTIAVNNVLQFAGQTYSNWQMGPINTGYIDTWFAASGNYPSNADVWWYFKDNTDVFNPASTIGNVSLSTGNAPQGHFILNAFTQYRNGASGLAINTVATSVRPKTGAWFQGRVWYAGVDANYPAFQNTGDYSWTENIYFSQIVTDPTDFGNCYQTNDPTSENLFDLLPTDGGVIQIQGCGSVYKLFPIQNGMLVFAANGIWFITGSQGIGFSANDYTITKISSVQSISGTSLVNVQGLPYFWNEEGIYSVSPSQQGGLTVEPITVGTILTFYNSIPTSSKKYARGDYHPIDYVIQWVYRDTEAADTETTYQFNKILNYNTYNKAFFPYTVSQQSSFIAGINYVSSPGGIGNTPDPVFKYLTLRNGVGITFAEENDASYVDWAGEVSGGINYDSYFVTGYKLHGQGQKRFQLPYIYVYSKNDVATAYKIQSIWDYANDPNSGKYSSQQVIYNNKPYFGMIFRRHRLRGQGIVLQIKITSVDGYPFDVMGWSTFENMNAGI